MHNTSTNTSMRHIENTLIATDPGKERYDATLKELMSSRQFLSRILKRFVPEYEHVPLCDIESDLIEPGSIKVGQVSVERNLSNIEGLNTEDKTLNEGNIYYDIVFSALGIREDQKIEEEVRDMGSFADAIERRALDQGYAKGIDQGMDNEKESTTRLFRFLKDNGKTEELEQAMFDSDQRERLYRLYNIT